MRWTAFVRSGTSLIVAVPFAATLAACGGPAQQTRADEPALVEKGGPAVEVEDLTERKVVKPKEPEWVEGVDRDAQTSFRAGVVAVAKVPSDYPAAIASFEDAISRDKAFLEAYFNLGMTYERVGKPEEAIKVYQRALAANPGSLDAQGSVGKVYLSLAKRSRQGGNLAEATNYEVEAKRIFDAIIAVDPDNVTANNAVALYWLYHGDAKTAEDFVKKVLMLQPKNVVALNTRGLINLMSGRLSIARWVFEEKALREDPNSTEAWTNLGLTYLKLGKTPQAVASFEKAVKANSDNFEARLDVAAIYLEYLHYQAALTEYDAVLRIVPDHIDALIGSGSCLLGLHRPKEAVGRWEAAIAAAPAKVLLYARIGKVYETVLNDMDKAIANYDLYVQKANPGPGDPVIVKLPVLKQMREQGGMKGPDAAPAPDATLTPDAAAPVPVTP